MSIAARFEIHYSQFLDHHGKAVQPLPDFAQDPDALIPFYRAMVLMRAYDAKAIALQRTGQLGTYAPLLGQEAVNAAIGHAMRKDDVLVGTYRENGAQLLRGVAMRELFVYWGGDERGSAYSDQPHDFPMCVTIAAQATHAAGVGYAIRLRRQPRAVVCALGDGATSKGDFYEGLNAAGVWQLPLVFLVSNNQWAISVPRAHQSASQTLAQKAIAAGIPGEQVDGNDVIAVYHALHQALEKARDGGGPALVEALTYRLSDHTTADDASRYRSADDVAEQWQYEPIVRLRTYLENAGAWDKAREDALIRECAQEVQAQAQAYLDTPPPPLQQMFDYLYATLPAALAAQRATALARKGGGDG
ncbi:MAG TPA: pyruvate dehydrogenase (acetyl-transferring) E1 component subunit alpha [Burkholderiales bacterium]|nr:pyruvate dehydrogenase (acetyl-transferring) E1 component subunit alpha [Burkholderiales bacterium]